MPAIEAQDLEKTFGGSVKALAGVSFEVEEATVFGLLGPNGAGKTTAVRILTTTLRPDRGVGRVLGRDVVREAATVRSLIGLAGQFAAVDENLTGRENLRMVGRLNHLPKPVVAERSDELLTLFGLEDAADRTLKTFSGGMRRRLDVAAALVARPPVLFLDEPTTGLDPQSRIDLWGVIERLVVGGTTVLLTTQYLEEADRLAGRVGVVDRGTLIAEGTPQELKADLGATVLDMGFADTETAAKVAGLLATLGTKPPHLADKKVEITVANGSRAAMEALRALDQANLEPVGFALREPSLDDVFLALTGHQAEEADPAGPGGKPAGKGGRRGRQRRERAGTTGEAGR
jgi:ABC-2 type transport system ATP-binding protein